MKATTLSWLLVLCSLLLFAEVVAEGQTLAGPDRPMSLNVAVTTKGGEWLGGLKAENFRVYEGKVERKIASMSVDPPLTVGILIDTSGSTSKKTIGEMLGAAAQFVRRCGKDTEYFLIIFNEEQRLVLDKTEDRDKVLRAIDSLASVEPKKNTAFYDALSLGIAKASDGKYVKKALVVISDGMDNASKARLAEVRRATRQSDVIIHGLQSIASEDLKSMLASQAIAVMDELADLSGGRVFMPDEDTTLPDFGAQAAQDLRNQYTLELVPAEPPEDNGWRKLEVKVYVPSSEDKLRKVRVRTREGYYPAIGRN